MTTVAINGGAGTIMVTGSPRSTVAVTERAYNSVTKKPPVTSHGVSGTTLTLSYSCPAQLTCGVAYDVQVPRGVTVRVSDREGAITLASVTASTNAGSITLTVPDSAAYQVHAHTYVGHSAVTVHQSATSKSVISASCDLGNARDQPVLKSTWLSGPAGRGARSRYVKKGDQSIGR